MTSKIYEGLFSFSRKTSLLLFFVCCYASSFAATADNEVKLLIQELNNQSEDTSKINLLNQIASKLSYSDPELGYKYAQNGLKLSKRVKYLIGIANSYVNIGFYYYDKSDYDAALQYFQKAIEVDKNNESRKAHCLNDIGKVHFRKGEYDRALAVTNEAKAYFIEASDSSGLSSSYNNFGLIYMYLADYRKALDNFYKALSINEKIGKERSAAVNHSNIGLIYVEQREFEKAVAALENSLEISESIQNLSQISTALGNLGHAYNKKGDYDKALDYFLRALEINTNLDSPYSKAVILTNLGAIYKAQGKHRDALKNAIESLEIKKSVSNLSGQAITLKIIAEIHFLENRLDTALLYAQEALAIAQQFRHKNISGEITLFISEIYAKNQNYKEAYLFQQKHRIITDSLFSEEKTKQIAQLQTLYETDKKEQEILLLNQDMVLQASQLKNKSMLQNLLYGAIGFIILFSFIGFRYTRVKQENKRFVLSEQLKIEKVEAERLQELDKLKGQFFSNIAHEFRTPLTLILGPLENVIEEIKNKAHKEQLSLVKNNASKLLRLINQLLDLSRLESGIIKIDPVQEDIIPFLKGITHSFHSLADQKGIKLEFHSFEEKLLMDFDKDKTEKILLNLLSNAFKFTPASGKIQVEINRENASDDPAKNLLKVTVRDSGIGIPKDQLSLVFNRFYQADNSQVREVEGSGIGLALTKELVEVQGGNIEVYSDQDEGATFTFRLPLTNESPIDIEANYESVISPKVDPEENLPALINGESSSVVMLPADQHTSKEIVLVIEDNEDVRRFISSSLKQTYKIIEAADGEEGIMMAKKHIPDLIISDVMMPQKDGYEACKAIKADEVTSHIPIILLTAKAGLESKLEGLETGADDYLPKPFNTKELKVRMKNLIRLRRNLREKYLQNALNEDKAKPASIAPIEDSFLKKVREMVEIHLDEEAFSIEDLSRELGMSRTQVHRKLKALTNQSASQFMRMIRLQHAKYLLNDGTNNVSEVAYKVGFSSPNYFSTCFTEFYGYAPSAQKKVDS